MSVDQSGADDKKMGDIVHSISRRRQLMAGWVGIYTFSFLVPRISASSRRRSHSPRPSLGSLRAAAAEIEPVCLAWPGLAWRPNFDIYMLWTQRKSETMKVRRRVNNNLIHFVAMKGFYSLKCLTFSKLHVDKTKLPQE